MSQADRCFRFQLVNVFTDGDAMLSGNPLAVFEMPFAGHPTLGTAHVVRALYSTADEVTLEMRAGIIPVRARQNTGQVIPVGQGEITLP